MEAVNSSYGKDGVLDLESSKRPISAALFDSQRLYTQKGVAPPQVQQSPLR
jgi:hypothetical protein